jgi:hypothetical protein
VRASDPLAAQVDCVGDLTRVPAAVARIAADVAHWLRVHRVTEGGAEASLALGGRWLGRDAAHDIVATAHARWRAAVDARPGAAAAMRYGLAAAVDAAKPRVWLPPAAWAPRTGR